MADWNTADSPLWDAKGHLDDAIQAITPGEFDDVLSAEEKAVTLPLRGLGVSLSAAVKPTADQIVPAIDAALVELGTMKKPTDRVKNAAEALKESRSAFVDLTSDPTEYASDEPEKVPAEEAESEGDAEGEGDEGAEEEGEETPAASA